MRCDKSGVISVLNRSQKGSDLGVEALSRFDVDHVAGSGDHHELGSRGTSRRSASAKARMAGAMAAGWNSERIDVSSSTMSRPALSVRSVRIAAGTHAWGAS